MSGSYELERRGLRFREPSAEAEYRQWTQKRNVPFTRIGMINSLIAWATVLAHTLKVAAEKPVHALRYE
jgi:hypothetical protein